MHISNSTNKDKLAELIAMVDNARVELHAPTEYTYVLWNAIKQSIKPHLDGVMPMLTEQAFATEQQSQRENRRRLYRSESSYLLAQSIQDVYKIAQSDDFLIDFGIELENILKRTYAGSKRLGKNIIKNIFSVVYLDRVRDPNGYLGIVPHNYQNGTLGDKAYTLELYPSENIRYASRDCMVFALPNGSSRVYTKNSTFLINGKGELASEPFIHSSGDLGVYILGGVPQNYEINNGKYSTMDSSQTNQQDYVRPITPTELVEVQMSDYSFVTNKLDKLENRNSQNEVVLILHSSPRLVARDLTCNDCDGTGQIQSTDYNGNVLNRVVDNPNGGEPLFVPQMHTCGTCNGKKIIDIGTQDVITIPMPMANEPTDGNQQSISDLAKGVLAYVTPEVVSSEFLYKQYQDTINEVKQMLRLQDTETANESGYAKRIDQEAAQPRLRAVAEGLQTLIENVLNGLVNFEFVAAANSSRKTTALQQIRVSIPSFFDLLSVAESKELYYLNLTQKPLYERYSEQLNIIKKQYNDPEKAAIFKIAYAYTKGANLLTLEELSTNKALGVLTENEIYIAQFIDAIIQYDILTPAAERMQPIDIMDTPKSEFIALIEIAIAPIVARRAAAASLVQQAAQMLNELPMDSIN